MTLRADQLRVGDWVDLGDDELWLLEVTETVKQRSGGRIRLTLTGHRVVRFRPDAAVEVSEATDGESTSAIPHANYPHEPGRLHSCPACEARCFCDTDPGTTECIFSGDHQWTKEFA